MSNPSLPGGPAGVEPVAMLAVVAESVAGLSGADPTRARVADLGQLLISLQGVLDALEGIAARWTKVFGDSGGPEEAGAPTLAAWMRRELRLTPADARRRVRAALVLDTFPTTRRALFQGEIHQRHLDVIAHGLHQLGASAFAEFEEIVLDVARECDADSVRQAITKIRDSLDPDAADAAYVRALERRDVTITPVGDGMALGGFLPPDTGAMFREVLYAAAKPRDKDDDRSAGQRRVDGLHELCQSVLEHGLPSDRGLRPHLFVTVTAERLEGATAGQPTVGTEPAALAGYGDISDTLLSKLACDCAITPVVLEGRTSQHVLNVGRTQRLATLKQRQAIHVQQGGTCANPGCDRTHLEIHHCVPWSVGGETNLADLRGYCTRCHHLIHQGLLVLKPDGRGGWAHHARRDRQLTDRRRHWSRATTRFTRDVMAGGVEHAREQRRRWHRGQPAQPPPDPVRRT